MEKYYIIIERITFLKLFEFWIIFIFLFFQNIKNQFCIIIFNENQKDYHSEFQQIHRYCLCTVGKVSLVRHPILHNPILLEIQTSIENKDNQKCKYIVMLIKSPWESSPILFGKLWTMDIKASTLPQENMSQSIATWWIRWDQMKHKLRVRKLWEI